MRWEGSGKGEGPGGGGGADIVEPNGEKVGTRVYIQCVCVWKCF